MPNFTPLGLMRLLTSMRLGLGTGAHNPVLQSLISTEASDRFAPKLPTYMAQPVQQQVQAKQSVVQEPAEATLAKMVLSSLAQMQSQRVPQAMTAPNQPALTEMHQRAIEGAVSNIIAYRLRQRLEQARQLLTQPSTTPLTTHPTTPIATPNRFNLMDVVRQSLINSSNLANQRLLQNALQRATQNIHQAPLRLTRLLGGGGIGGKL